MINIKQVAQMNILPFTNFYKIYSFASRQFGLPDITRLKDPSSVSFYRSADMAVDQYKIFYDDAGYPSYILNDVIKRCKRSICLLRTDYIHKLEKCPDDNIERCFNDIIMILENPSLPYFYSTTGSGEPYSSCLKAFCSGVHNYISDLQCIFRLLSEFGEISENDWQLIKDKLTILEEKYGANSTSGASRYLDPALARCIRNSQFGLVSKKPVFNNPYFGKHFFDSALEPVCTFDKIDENVLVRSNPAMAICLRKATADDFIKFSGIKKVIFNYPATIVWWADGSKTIVKVHKGEEFNKEMGLAMAIAKKAFGDTTGSRAAFKKVVNMADDHSMTDIYLYMKSNKTHGYLIKNIKFDDARKLANNWFDLNIDDHDYTFAYSGNKIKNSSKAQIVPLDQMKSIIESYRESKQIIMGEFKKDISEED